MLTPTRINPSITESFVTDMGVITPEIPRMARTLKMLEPTTFPTAISFSPLRAAVMEVTSSGRLVPTAQIVRPTRVSLMPAFIAISFACSTTRFPPRTIPATPPIRLMAHTMGEKSAGTAVSSAFDASFLAILTDTII